MHLSEFNSTNFRNLSQTNLVFSPKLNVVSGSNGAGKSSLLEAVVFLVSGRSFRTSKQNLMIAHNEEDSILFGRFSDSTKTGINLKRLGSQKIFKINGDKINSLSSVAAIYPVQVLCPESYHFIDSGPNERRKYLDWSLFHVEHEYLESWRFFKRILKQRNSLLKSGSQNVAAEINSWDQKFSELSKIITGYRLGIVEKLLPLTRAILEKVNFENLSELSFSYYPGYSGDLLSKLNESFHRDINTGNTSYGPHKSDFRIKIGVHLAKDILSRGQKKLLINCLYLAQTELLKAETNKDSLFVVDDFSSELDRSNQSVLIDALREQDNVQVILSCLQTDVLKPLIKEYNSVSMFHVEQGIIEPTELY